MASMVARQLKNTRLITMAATLYGELKQPFFRNEEIYFKIGFINAYRLNINLFLIWSMMTLPVTL